MEPSSSSGQVKIYGNTKLSDNVNAFQHTVVQKQSKFSVGSKSKVIETGKSASDSNYGRPVEGSKTDKRGKAAAMHIGNEVQQLCSVIKEYGQQVYDPDDPTNGPYYMITFKEIFDIYQVISNKVVGILLRARKHGLVDFEGEMLFQRRDDKVVITLIVDPTLIQADQDSTSCVKSQT